MAATPMGALPQRVWPSVRPSPVTTREAEAACSLKAPSAKTSSAPGLNSAFE